MPIYPVWIHDKTAPKPDVPVFYEISANGAFLHKETPFWRAIVPVQRISVLEEQRPQIEILLPPIPGAILRAVARFFAWITKEHNTEALVLLWWGGPGQGEYRITVPTQRVTSRSVKYDIPDVDGYRLIGTLHSHGSISSFHSEVDREDEKSFDGIHGTFGGFLSSVNKNRFDLSLQVGINEARFVLEPWLWAEGICKVSSQEQLPVANVRFLRLPIRARDSIQEYELADGEELLPKGFAPPSEWLENIEFEKFGVLDVIEYAKSQPRIWSWNKSDESTPKEEK